jgi:hypothetical protein
MIIATEGRGKKLALITALFWTYMEPLWHVSRGKTGEADTGKRDYRHHSKTGCDDKRRIVEIKHSILLYAYKLRKMNV